MPPPAGRVGRTDPPLIGFRVAASATSCVWSGLARGVRKMTCACCKPPAMCRRIMQTLPLLQHTIKRSRTSVLSGVQAALLASGWTHAASPTLCRRPAERGTYHAGQKILLPFTSSILGSFVARFTLARAQRFPSLAVQLHVLSSLTALRRSCGRQNSPPAQRCFGRCSNTLCAAGRYGGDAGASDGHCGATGAGKT